MLDNFSENEVNVKEFKINYLINYLINYYYNNKKKNKKPITLYMDVDLFSEFSEVCKKLGLTRGRSKGNIAIEGFMSFMVEKFKDSPKIVQTTLFYKPQINIQQKNVEVNIVQKLELKLVKKDLVNVLDALENRQGNLDFYLSRLREVLPKALRVYERTESEELQELLEKAEKWV